MTMTEPRRDWRALEEDGCNLADRLVSSQDNSERLRAVFHALAAECKRLEREYLLTGKDVDMWMHKAAELESELEEVRADRDRQRRNIENEYHEHMDLGDA